MRFRLSVLSKPGGRHRNEDAAGVWWHPASTGCFCVLSDGVGGHPGGDEAARLAVESVLRWFHGHPVPSAEQVAGALMSANRRIMQVQRVVPAMAFMRATAVVCAVDLVVGRASWAHVGDSRLYVFRNGRIVARTHDQSVVQALVDAGEVDPREALDNPHRSELLAALGDDEAFAYAAPDAILLRPGDRLLLCTDGVWEHVDDAELARLARAAASPESFLMKVEARVLALAPAGHDNYSAIAITCDAT